jgi:hypothetical protein
MLITVMMKVNQKERTKILIEYICLSMTMTIDDKFVLNNFLKNNETEILQGSFYETRKQLIIDAV